MEIRDFFKLTNEFNSDILTIGEMLDKLNQFEDDQTITFSNGLFFDGNFGSYRGYYKDLYIGCDSENRGLNKVGKLKEALNDALRIGFMVGYKGGEYPINEDTLVWLADYGDTGDMIVDIQKINDEIFVIIKKD